LEVEPVSVDRPFWASSESFRQRKY